MADTAILSCSSALKATIRALGSFEARMEFACEALDGNLLDAAREHVALLEQPLMHALEALSIAHDRAPAGTASAWLLSVNAVTVDCSVLLHVSAGLQALLSSPLTGLGASEWYVDARQIWASGRLALNTVRGLLATIERPADVLVRSPPAERCGPTLLERVHVALQLLPSRGPTHEEMAEDPGALDACLADVRRELEALKAELSAVEVRHG